MVDSITTTFGGGNSEKVYYIYGDTGNINRVESLQNGVRYYDNTYKYDDLGQLIREDNRSAGKTYVFTYDNAGNITNKKTYAYTTADTITTSLLDTVIYEYNDPSCGDLLTKYDGHSISYDSCLNPVTYYAGGETYTMTWTRGRRLSSMSSGSQTLSFTYNDEGIRTSKTVNGTKHTYSLSGSQILSEEWYTGTTQHLILYVYDANGSPIGMRYRNSTYSGAWLDSYMFVKNLQGDIIYIYDEDGNRIVTYSYDAWGNILSVTGSAASTIGVMNPFRYRGYYYDEETGFYYVSSRYYDPEIGRWINADNAISSTGGDILGYNLFVYCFNNPVNMDDQSGHWPEWLKNAAKAVARVVTQVKAVLNIPSTIVKIAATSTVAVVSGQATVGDVWNDVKKYSFFNDDETKVLESKVFSSYKGTPVLRHDISGITSFSVSNTIILNKSESVDNGGIDTVKHEWGHTVQQSLIGTSKYMTRIAVPSVISCIVNPSSKTYYSLPWERTADFFGGANRTTGYYAGSGVVAGLYLIMP